MTELARELGMTQPRASKHLRVLREVGLVQERYPKVMNVCKKEDPAETLLDRDHLVRCHLCLCAVAGPNAA